MRRFLFSFLLLAPILAFGQRQDQRVGAVPSVTVTIGVGAGDITNIVWASNTRYLLPFGTNTVRVFQDHVGDPHLMIRDKTNITIEGVGWQSVVYTAQTGTVFCVYNCSDITFRNFQILGTRGPETGATFTSQFAAVEHRGTNVNILYDHMKFKNHSDQGICQVHDLTTYTTNCHILNSWFEQIGTTNCDLAGGSDGTAIVPDGPHWIMEDNNYVYNFRDCEPFTANGAQPIKGLKYVHNISVGCKGIGFYSIAANMDDFLILGNSWTYDSTKQVSSGPHNGLAITGLRNSIISDNTIKYADIGMMLWVQAANDMFVNNVIADNKLLNCVNGIMLRTSIAGATNAGNIVRGNTFAYNLFQGLLFNGTAQQIINNSFNRNGTLNAGAHIQMDSPGGIGGFSNTVSGNIFWSDNSIVTGQNTYCIEVNSGNNNNLFKDNRYQDYSTGPWLDNGGFNKWIDNWVGTNLIRNVALTNTYATTNVFINVAANPWQVVLATNAMLCVVTNSAQLSSSEEVWVSFINNGATNQNVVWAAGPRFYGSGASNTVVAGKTMEVNIKKVGTNLDVICWPQTN